MPVVVIPVSANVMLPLPDGLLPEALALNVTLAPLVRMPDPLENEMPPPDTIDTVPLAPVVATLRANPPANDTPPDPALMLMAPLLVWIGALPMLIDPVPPLVVSVIDPPV